MTQIELAGRCNLSRAATSQFEHGQASPSMETLGRILAVLEADLSDLQRQLDRRPQAPAEPAQHLVEVGGARLGGHEVERRLGEVLRPARPELARESSTRLGTTTITNRRARRR